MKVTKKIKSLMLSVILLLSSVTLVNIDVQAATYSFLFPVKNGKIAYVYGNSTAYGGWHDGIDIHSTGDDTIYAAADGTVGVATDPCPHVNYGAACAHYATFGNYIRIDHNDGTSTYYGHLKQGSLKVSVGTRVTKGQAIATMGSSGYSTGKHLHFEVRKNGTKINVNPVSSGGSVNYSYTYSSETINYAAIEEKDYYLRNKSTGWYLNVSWAKDEDCTQIHAYKFENYISQMVSIQKTKDGYQMVPRSSSSGKVVNPYADTVVSGKNVNLYHNTNESSQWWKFQPKNGGYVVRNVQNPNVCLTVDSGGNIIVSTYNGGDNQIWYLEIRCQIKYYANGGTGGPEMWYARSGYETKLSDKKPTRTGYTFLGWATNSKASTAKYQPGDVVPINNDINLYAVWKNNSVSNNEKDVSVKTTKINKVIKKASSTKAKIKLKKVEDVTGYNIKISTSKKFKKNKTVSKNTKKTVINVKKLKAYKKYYIKARCYKVINGKKYYSKWTKIKKIG